MLRCSRRASLPNRGLRHRLQTATRDRRPWEGSSGKWSAPKSRSEATQTQTLALNVQARCRPKVKIRVEAALALTGQARPGLRARARKKAESPLFPHLHNASCRHVTRFLILASPTASSSTVKSTQGFTFGTNNRPTLASKTARQMPGPGEYDWKSTMGIQPTSRWGLGSRKEGSVNTPPLWQRPLSPFPPPLCPLTFLRCPALLAGTRQVGGSSSAPRTGRVWRQAWWVERAPPCVWLVLATSLVRRGARTL